jgi:hypothetical protein
VPVQPTYQVLLCARLPATLASLSLESRAVTWVFYHWQVACRSLATAPVLLSTVLLATVPKRWPREPRVSQRVPSATWLRELRLAFKELYILHRACHKAALYHRHQQMHSLEAARELFLTVPPVSCRVTQATTILELVLASLEFSHQRAVFLLVVMAALPLQTQP